MFFPLNFFIIHNFFIYLIVLNLVCPVIVYLGPVSSFRVLYRVHFSHFLSSCAPCRLICLTFSIKMSSTIAAVDLPLLVMFLFPSS